MSASADYMLSNIDGIRHLIAQVDAGFICDPMICAEELQQKCGGKRWGLVKEQIERIAFAKTTLEILLED